MDYPCEKGSLILAPMAGVNDPAFRLICKQHGASLTYTEMISAKGLLYGNVKTTDMLFAMPDEGKFAVQLFGREIPFIAKACAWLEDNFGDSLALIDFNVCCPARKVVSKGEGAALLREPELVAKILLEMRAATSLPITVKIRAGFKNEFGSGYEDTNTSDITEFAKMLEQCGVAAVAVHGRSAEQFYHGRADRSIVGKLACALRIPVIASGDVFSGNDIADYLLNQNAYAVMLARGAQGNPWLFSMKQGTINQRVEVAKKHAQILARVSPWRLPSMRKHIAWYFKGLPHSVAIRRSVNQCMKLPDYLNLLDSVLTYYDHR